MIEEYIPNYISNQSELESLIKIWQVMIEKQYSGGTVIKETLKDRALGAVEIFQIFKAALKTNE